MTDIHYDPPPDDAPTHVLAWNPELPYRWLDRSSDLVRLQWGRPFTAWKEQPPLPTPEPGPVPLEVGMEVRRRGSQEGLSRIVLAWATLPNGVAYVWTWTGVGHDLFLVLDVETLDGRPVCLPDDPAPVDRQTAEAIRERIIAAALDGPSCSGGVDVEGCYTKGVIDRIRNVDLSDLPDPAESWTTERVERAMEDLGYARGAVLALLDALRDGEGE